MSAELAGFVLAAGQGSRLRPLTDLRPKGLCPINNVPLVDSAIAKIHSHVSNVTVNAWHHAEQIVEHFDRAAIANVRVAVEHELLGTAGSLGAQRDWIDGRPTLVHNADAWSQADLSEFCGTWDGERVRLLVQRVNERADFDGFRFCGVSLNPWSEVSKLNATPSGLWEVSWRALHAQGRLDFVELAGPYFDCGTPADYLTANMTASGGVNVVGAGSVVNGSIERCVIWPGGRVEAHEHLVDAIRADQGVTVNASPTTEAQ